MLDGNAGDDEMQCDSYPSSLLHQMEREVSCSIHRRRVNKEKERFH